MDAREVINSTINRIIQKDLYPSLAIQIVTMAKLTFGPPYHPFQP